MHSAKGVNSESDVPEIVIGYWTNTVFWDRVLWSEFDHEVINPTKERGPKTLYEFNNRIIIYLYKIINLIKSIIFMLDYW